MTDADKPKTATTAPKAAALPADRPPKPSRGTPWRHQDGCTNPNAEDWNCPCGPEVYSAE